MSSEQIETSPGRISDEILRLQESFGALKAEVSKVLVGQEDMLHKLLLGFLAGGHVLLKACLASPKPW